MMVVVVWEPDQTTNIKKRVTEKKKKRVTGLHKKREKIWSSMQKIKSPIRENILKALEIPSLEEAADGSSTR